MTLQANELWNLFKEVDGNVYCLDEHTWLDGQREHLSWNNHNPTTPNPQLVEELEHDVTVLQAVIGKLKQGWELS